MEDFLQHRDEQYALKEKCVEGIHGANGFMNRFMCNCKRHDV
jgi:hypothetical protein